MNRSLAERADGRGRRLFWALAGSCFCLGPVSLLPSRLAPGIVPVRQKAWLLLVPLLALALAALIGDWVRARRQLRTLKRGLGRTAEAVRQRERERDSAQDELIRRLQQERELHTEKLQFQNQLADFEKYAALARLALGAAHEVNNPLLGILSHLELELKAAPGEEERAEIEQCIEGARRISSTIRGLLNYTRPGPLLFSKINLERLVSDTLAFLRNQPLLRGIRLQNEVPPDLPVMHADANQLSQVLMNLLLNAAEATPAGGSIRISAEKVKFTDSIEIRISDTGCGIPAEVLPHIFEPFFTTKRGKGTGLGLSISQAYVRSHEGDIRVESVPQRGTTVRITLPLHPVGLAEAETQAEVVV